MRGTPRRNLFCQNSLLVSLLSLFLLGNAYAGSYDVGVYYFPGWHSKSANWKDIKGEPGSLSPGKPWRERFPLLGFYPEEEGWVAEKHIEWASSYGIDFLAYDWYWDGKIPLRDHAINAYLRAKNREKLKFCIMWANHTEVPRTLEEFTRLIDFWIDNYFKTPGYYSFEGKPLVFIFSWGLLHTNARRFGESGAKLIARANQIAKGKGLKGLYFIAMSNERPDLMWAREFAHQGFSAYTGWNYVVGNSELRLDYEVMVDTYLEFYEVAKKANGILPYIIPTSPGWDSRPWHGDKAYVRENPSPQKFERMLQGAKNLALQPGHGPKVIMIESWNEFSEGSYIEPTQHWGFKYLESIKRILKP